MAKLKALKDIVANLEENGVLEIPQGTEAEIVGACLVTGSYVDVELMGDIHRFNAGWFSRNFGA